MGTFVTAVVAYGEEEEDDEEEYYESEHLPPLLEDEENVSLADILSLRDSCLSEEEVLAVCVECVCSLQGITLSPLFHTLCITPDTLAFNAHGNVCFMEQLSDDPEGSFVPPEFDRTGSTFEGHVYSLGCTLCAALDFVIEPELKAELGAEVKRLLEQMQQEKPEDRPRPQDILSLGELRLTSSSSLTICRKLSSIGRRVLSIESVTTLQDRWETSWESHWRQVKACQLFSEQSSAGGCSGLGENHISDWGAAGSCADNSQEEDSDDHPPQQCHCPRPSPWRPGEKESCENGLMSREAGVPEGTQEVFQTPGDSRSQNSSPVHCRAPARRRPPWAVLHRSWSVPDSHDPPPTLSPPPHPDISSHVDDLTEIGADEPSAGRPLVWNQVPRRGSSSAPPPEDTSGPELLTAGAQAPADDNGSGVADWSESEAADDQTSPSSSSAETIRDSHMYSLNNHMTKSMLCLNEESQDEWISLRELLSRCARPLSVKELWALCYTCLATLQTYIDFPAYLCLDTVYVGCEGDILFLKPKTTGSCDAFYLAPEYLEHGIVTEKACVYGVAAILWATAKFNLSPNQKLAMPRKLKRLLLEMAKRTPLERPTIVMAKKSCRDYLSRQGTAAEAVWTQLINRVHKSPSGRPGEAHSDVDSTTHSQAQVKAAFKPIASKGLLAPVLGPIPHSYPFTTATHLPEAFTSPATHFIPIVLERNEGTDTEPPRAEAGAETTTNGALTRTDRSSPGSPEVTATRPPASGSPLPDTGSHLTEADRGGTSKAVGGLTQHDHSSSSSSSSSQTLVNSTPPVRHSTNHERDTQVPAPSNNCLPVFNNFLLHQDPQTGRVTLVPVQIATAQPFTGLDLSALPSTAGSVQSHISDPRMSDIINCSLKSAVGCTGAAASHRQTDSSPGCSATLDACAPTGRPQVRTAPSRLKPPDPSLPPSHQSCCPALLHVIALLREQFAYDGYMENGVHDLAMGQYIFSLRDLQFETFCRVITEKFYDLYWEEELLAMLYCTVNYDLLSVASNEQAPSKPVERASPSPQSAGRRDHTHQVESSHPDSRADPRPANSLAARTLDLPHPPELNREKGNTTKLRTTENASKRKSTHDKTPTPCLQERKQEVISKESREHGGTVEVRGVGGSLGGLMEGAGSPAVEAPDESPSEAEPLSPLEGWEELGGPCGALASRLGLELDPGDSGSSGQLHHDSSVDMEDADSLGSNSLGALGGLARGGPQGLGCHRPAWALALHGQECFNQEVMRYAGELGRHSKGSSSLEEKAQELHQQLIIETRNMRKTRNFHHKLLKQERKNKGSEAKVMLSKLRIQFEEQRTKVEFLDAVRKYLEVLCLDRQGVNVSLLPSLAKGGSGGLEIQPQPQDDPALLTLLPEARKGKGGSSSLLVSGTPLGLMSYLYARDAHIEGYVQQFLYTYRYFCKPEEVLQFLMETFRRVSGENHDDPSSDATKVLNRSLDLLHCWVEDCRMVDFPSKSGLQQTLTTFLCSEVAPLDCRGESLLAVLQGEQEKRWSQGESAPCWGTDCALEDGDTQLVHARCRRTSIDDGGKKSFQWRLSRVVEPQPKEPVFSIAAVLPRPCYSSLLKQMGPAACLRAEERLPFSQQPHGALHTAQHLTLLEQEMFHSCHPVHFLNSRAQGVKDKTMSRCVSSEALPAEGAGHVLSEASPQESPLLHLLRYGESVTNWVSAEIVICDSVKAQSALLAKFLSIAKCCYESRNFATAMQILTGLENVIIRQLPAWKHLGVKVCEIIEELRAVQVFLRSDSLCLVEGEPLRVKPTLPDAHILALHLQQLEIGAFTLTTGAYKWPKLRTLARVVSQVHAFQEFPYPYAADPEFQAYLRVRIARLGSCDVPLLAADNEANFHQLPSSDRHSRRVQETLRRVRATFQ